MCCPLPEMVTSPYKLKILELGENLQTFTQTNIKQTPIFFSIIDSILTYVYIVYIFFYGNVNLLRKRWLINFNIKVYLMKVSFIQWIRVVDMFAGITCILFFIFASTKHLHVWRLVMYLMLSLTFEKINFLKTFFVKAGCMKLNI